MKNRSIAGQLSQLGTIVALGLILAVGASVASTLYLRINGPVYRQIVLGKDLVADILPPPEYVIEAYLEATLIINQPEGYSYHAHRLVQLRKDYDDRRAYWLAANLPEELKYQLTVHSDKEAQAFWTAVEQGMLPAVKRGDLNAANAAYAKARLAYGRHRKIIDQVVAQSNAWSAKLEKEAMALTVLAFVAVGLCAVIIFAALARAILGFRHRVVVPVQQVTKAIIDLSNGNMEAPLPPAGRTEEIDAMARAFEVLRSLSIEARAFEEASRAHRELEDEALRRAADEAMRSERALVVERLGEGIARLAQCDLTVRLSSHLPKEYSKLRYDFNAAMEQLSTLVREVASASYGLNNDIEQISQSASDLAQRTDTQATHLEQTAAAIGKITSHVVQGAQNAAKTAKTAETVLEVAKHSSEVVQQAVMAMSEISNGAREIANITGTIDEIAFQTNLLALNSGVEAARAGEAGRGFAVVAQEVRALAQRSASAAREIKELVANSVAQVDKGVALVGETGRSLEVIEDAIMTMDELISAIADATQDQSQQLTQVNVAISDLDRGTQENAAMAQEYNQVAAGLLSNAHRLTDLVSHLTVDQEPERDHAKAYAASRGAA